MVVYIDLIFMTNLLIDGALLLVTAWMRRQRVRVWRILFASVLGALYVLMMFLPELSFLFTFLTKFIFSVVMLWIAFGFRSLQNYLRNLGAFYIVNFVAAGGVLGSYYLLQSSGEIWNGIWYSSTGGLEFQLKIGSFFSFAVLFVVLWWFKKVQLAKRRQQQTADYIRHVEVRIGDSIVACEGLIDTGNQLTCPLSRMPVMVMEASLWQEHLPGEWGAKLAAGEADNLILELGEDESFPWRDRLRLVPYRGINKGSQFMLALKPDEVILSLQGTQITTKRVLVGLDGGRLSSEGSYQAIIHPALAEQQAEAMEPVRALSS
ncbi:sigma-E processing peptidase SpoIIGA [Paenibacillus sp. CAA11]|uniref:sigma-E processing peptidase SpoIIGA n=1 Tax=Paenibacillus sp. CAA11 TaxID=1532905 RepID=UPI000D3349C8|nr:sigma-E processing peptidase SpoIIGA [Paenibacillus sp. CAA11]AWB45359.1 sigma-E processing peptidase SpoIIGA [Paenibacillus sp. CAA11]